MSELSDKIAYIKGLCAGLEMNDDTPEHKLLMAIVDALDGVKDELDALRASHEELETYVDVLDDDINELECEVYGDYNKDDDFEDEDDDESEEDDDEDDGCDDDCDCGCHHGHMTHDEAMDLPLVERPCPNCGKTIEISMRALFNRDEPIICPHCGGKFRAQDPHDKK